MELKGATIDYRERHTWDWKLAADPHLQPGVKAVLTLQQKVEEK